MTNRRKLERKFSEVYQLITRDDRLDIIAKDIVEHFTTKGDRGKAMVISIDKATSVIMYEKVQMYWQQHLKDLKNKIEKANSDEKVAFWIFTNI